MLVLVLPWNLHVADLELRICEALISDRKLVISHIQFIHHTRASAGLCPELAPGLFPFQF